MRALLLFLCLSLPHLISGAPVTVENFETTDPAHIEHNQDVNVSQTVVMSARNELDGSRCLEFTALLAGPKTGWAGCKIPVRLAAGGDTLQIDACGLGRSRGVFLTLTEQDGSRWNCSVRVNAAWSRHRIPLYEFSWFMGPQSRRHTRPRLESVVSIDPWVGNVFEGPNGFRIDNIQMLDLFPEMHLKLLSTGELPLQKPTTITVEARSSTDQPVSCTGTLWIAAADRNLVNIPEHVLMVNGRAEIRVFPRRAGTLDLWFFEAHTHSTLKHSFNVPQGPRLEFAIPEYQGQQLMFAAQTISPTLKLEGAGALPLSVHVRAADHRGRTIISKFFSVPEIMGGKGKFRLPQPGIFSIECRALREPITSFATVQDNVPIPLHQVTTATEELPRGVTSETISGSVVLMEPLPTTATIIAQDEFTLWSVVLSPKENTMWRSPMGICSGALFHLPMQDIPTTGNSRLMWHRRLGSFWGRNDLWWHETQPGPGSTNWIKADMVADTYRNNVLNVMGILAYESNWSREQSPATPAERELWRKWVGQLFDRYEAKIKAFEVWNEPNHGFWKPAPDADQYRELVKVTYEELQAHLKRRTVPGPIPKLGAGVTAGFDPAFLSRMMQDGFVNSFDALSFHPYPDRHSASPEANAYSEILGEAGALLRRYNAGKEIWVSEIGWPSTPFSVDEKTQANYLVRTYAISTYYKINKVFWFNLYDWTQLPWEGEWDAHTGLLDSNYRPKPSAISYNIMAYMMCRLEPRRMTSQGKATIYTFDILQQSTKWPGTMHIAWTPEPGDEAEIELPIAGKGRLFVSDYLGAEHMPLPHKDSQTTQTADSDGLTSRTERFRVTHEPLYIWDSGSPPTRPAAVQER